MRQHYMLHAELRFTSSECTAAETGGNNSVFAIKTLELLSDISVEGKAKAQAAAEVNQMISAHEGPHRTD